MGMNFSDHTDQRSIDLSFDTKAQTFSILILLSVKKFFPQFSNPPLLQCLFWTYPLVYLLFQKFLTHLYRNWRSTYIRFWALLRTFYPPFIQALKISTLWFFLFIYFIVFLRYRLTNTIISKYLD